MVLIKEERESRQPHLRNRKIANYRYRKNLIAAIKRRFAELTRTNASQGRAKVNQ
jgi:hypothetical protein